MPKTRIYVAAWAFFSHSLTASGPNFSPSVGPNLLENSEKLATVTGTNAGPFPDVPMTPAGIPVGPVEEGAERSISLVDTPALLNVNSAIYRISRYALIIKYVLLKANTRISNHKINNYKFNCPGRN